MANTKISGLSSASTPLSGSEILPLNQSGTTDSVSVTNLTAGRTPSALGWNATNGVFNKATVSAGSTGTPTEERGLTYGNSNTALNFWNIYQNTNRSWASISTTNDSNTTLETTTFHPYNGTTANQGNFVVGSAGNGVLFSANTPASGMTSQNLTWYEEGAWTPALGGTWLTNPTGLAGAYVRIGRQVTIQLIFVGGTKSTAVSGYFTGLPFPTNYIASGTVTDTDITNRGQCLAANTNRIWVTNTTFSAGNNICSVTYMT